MIKPSGMTITPAVSTAMTSPTVPHHHLLQQQKTSRVSNFSVASLLADTRPSQLSVAAAAQLMLPLLPPSSLATTILTAPSMTSPINLKSPSSLITANNNNSTSSNNNNSNASESENRRNSLPTNLSNSESLQHHRLHGHHLPHQLLRMNGNNSPTSNSTSRNDRHTPHSSVSAESDNEYDSNADDDDNSIVDIEDLRNESSTTPPNFEIENSTRMLMASAANAALGNHVPIRPTPFSALAAATAAAWNGMGNGGPAWPGARQMPLFGSNMFPGQGFGGHVGGG